MTPDLEPRFLQPDHWQWEFFERKTGRQLRFGYVIPENPRAIIVMLPGLSEFCEKHFETAHWALEHNFGFFVLDWFGQGKSGRYLDNPHKRHSDGFDQDVLDLEFWIEHHIHPAADTPFIMLSLSMGANIGLHYMASNPSTFHGTAFVAPMFGIKSMNAIPLSSQISRILKRFAADSYVPGGGDWRESMHPSPKHSILTKDPKRNLIHNIWSLADHALQIGGITFGWVYEAHKACKTLIAAKIERLNTPFLIACAQHEKLVDNKATRKIASRMPNVKLMMLKDSYHEPLMERDDIRDSFLKEFLIMIEESLKDAP